MNKIALRFALVALMLSALCSRAGAQGASLSTNVFDYAQLGTLNMEASCGFARHWSINAGVKYNPWDFVNPKTQDRIQARQRALSIGTRFWPWHIYSGWWISGKMQYQEFSQGGIRSLETSEGDRYGGGLSGGFTYMIHKHLNVEVGVGIWAGHETYTTYACPVCGRVVAKGEGVFMRPNDFLLSLSYVF